MTLNRLRHFMKRIIKNEKIIFPLFFIINFSWCYFDLDGNLFGCVFAAAGWTLYLYKSLSYNDKQTKEIAELISRLEMVKSGSNMIDRKIKKENVFIH